MIKVPKTCLICESPWAGGHERPGWPMQPGLRVFYGCGASLSCLVLSKGIYQLLIKNCQTEEPPMSYCGLCKKSFEFSKGIAHYIGAEPVLLCPQCADGRAAFLPSWELYDKIYKR